MICENCFAPRESPLHYITQCESFAALRFVMLDKVQQFIPNIHILSKSRQYDILVNGYHIDNDELMKYNTKIMIATQTFIYDTKRFCTKRKLPPPLPPPASPIPPTPIAPPAPPPFIS